MKYTLITLFLILFATKSYSKEVVYFVSVANDSTKIVYVSNAAIIDLAASDHPYQPIYDMVENQLKEKLGINFYLYVNNISIRLYADDGHWFDSIEDANMFIQTVIERYKTSGFRVIESKLLK